MLYPAYFDGRKTMKQGRRVSKELAVNTDPTEGGIPLTCMHLAMACDRLGVGKILVEEGKRYDKPNQLVHFTSYYEGIRAITLDMVVFVSWPTFPLPTM
jgi:signal recognition particle subunit SEC65